MLDSFSMVAAMEVYSTAQYLIKEAVQKLEHYWTSSDPMKWLMFVKCMEVCVKVMHRYLVQSTTTDKHELSVLAWLTNTSHLKETMLAPQMSTQ